LLLAACGLGACCLQPLQAEAGSQALHVFSKSIRDISPLPKGVLAPQNRPYLLRSSLSAKESQEELVVEVALRMRNFDELQARIARGELVSRTEMLERYLPLEADHEAVLAHLKARGLTVRKTFGTRIAIFVSAPVSVVAEAFHADFGRVSFQGVEYSSALSAPSLPASISPLVAGIHGLQPHIRPHRMSKALPIPRGGSGPSGVFLPSDIAAVYNVASTGLTGAGQTIGLYARTYPTKSDLESFWKVAKVSTQYSQVVQVDVSGGPDGTADEMDKLEACLDVEWASAMAPAAKIRIYGVDATSSTGFDEMFQRVYDDAASDSTLRQFSFSYGYGENLVPDDYLFVESQYLAMLASSGITVVASSGDTGPYDDPSQPTVPQVDYPASDPNVTGVGGTSLTTSLSGLVLSETAWPKSGGGVSAHFFRPSWQKGTGVPAGSMRLVPDVAAIGDPGTGVIVVYSGSQYIAGGTSLGSPVWAGFSALINQSRASAGLSPLGLLNARLYPQLGSALFRDVVSGSNELFSAGTGYDLLTGLGVPDLGAIVLSPLSSSGVPVVADQLGDRFTTVGQPVAFSVAAVGDAPLSYQWQRLAAGTSGWQDLREDSTFTGTRSMTMAILGTPQSLNGDQFRCVVSNSLGAQVSPRSSRLTVNTCGSSTLAGLARTLGTSDGNAGAARFGWVGSLRFDASGNLYVADTDSCTIRKVTAAGVVSTYAGKPGQFGSTDGALATARFGYISGVAVGADGSLYVADYGNYTIRKVDPSGVVSTLAGSTGVSGFADGTGTAARFIQPQNLAVDAQGNVYVADGKGYRVRKITPAGVVTTLAGTGVQGAQDGPAAQATFGILLGIVVGDDGSVYVSDGDNNTVRKISAGGTVSTLAGTAGLKGATDGEGGLARFWFPGGLALEASGNLLVVDSLNSTVRRITPSGTVTTVAGVAGVFDSHDGLPLESNFMLPSDIALDSSGNACIADSANHVVRKLVLGSRLVPVVTSEPTGKRVYEGQRATFFVTVTGTAPFTYQWRFNGAPVSGATSSTLSLDDPSTSSAGEYSVQVSNSEGSVISDVAVLTVDQAPQTPFVRHLSTDQLIVAGDGLTLSLSAGGQAPVSYQWYRDAVKLTGQEASTLRIDAASSLDSGRYTCVISNSLGQVTSDTMLVTVAPTYVVNTQARLTNISSRTLVGTDADVQTGGFVISGTAAKQVLVRASGPALLPFGVAEAIAKPQLQLFDSDHGNALIASNSGWDYDTIQPVASAVGAFGWTKGSKDAALLVTLQPGRYSATVSDVNGLSGVALLEIYEVDPSSRLVNISTRSPVGTGNNVQSAGFVISGAGMKTILLRASGPALANFGLINAIPDPVMEVYDAQSTLLFSNDNWDSASIQPVADSQGAFSWSTGSKDAALIVSLPAGQYTVLIKDKNGTKGIALVEVYELNK
jgi:sugar lactone lactonase YvrE